jgi:fructosamine-3-kinase
VLADAGGRPHLIDPAAYGGHREVDLAMLRLFGGGYGVQVASVARRYI